MLIKNKLNHKKHYAFNITFYLHLRIKEHPIFLIDFILFFCYFKNSVNNENVAVIMFFHKYQIILD